MSDTKQDTPFGTVELTEGERFRRERASGAVAQDHDVSSMNAIVARLAVELNEATAWERRAEKEYRQAMEKRIECMNVLMRAVGSLPCQETKKGHQT